MAVDRTCAVASCLRQFCAHEQLLEGNPSTNPSTNTNPNPSPDPDPNPNPSPTPTRTSSPNPTPHQALSATKPSLLRACLQHGIDAATPPTASVMHVAVHELLSAVMHGP